ncbi:MAG: outer membrane protein assembly factor BamD [Planctomycetota bacterium]|nr:MAG: outer membrane protein assembly factor BamD [Planctomycetota bacterium]
MLPFLLFLCSTLIAPPQQEADDQYHFVVGLYDKGLYDLVVNEAEQFIRAYPNHPKVDLTRYRLASALFELDRKAEATPQFERLVQLSEFPFLPEAYFRLGQCRLDAGDPAAAVVPLQQTLDSGKAYLQVPATFLMGEAWFRQGQFEQAEGFYRSAVQGDTGEEGGEYAKDARYGLAWCAFRLQNFEVAVQRIDDFLVHHQDQVLVAELLFLKGEAYFELESYSEALAAYQAVNGGPYADAAVRGSGFASAELGDHTGAAQFFQKLLDEFPDSPFRREAGLQRGIHLLKNGQPEQAKEALQFSELTPGAELEYWRARAEAEAGNPQLALNILEQALNQGPSGELADRLNAFRGDLLFDLNRLDEAVQAYQGSGSDYALHAAAVASLNHGRAEISVELSKRLLEAYPESPYQLQTQLTLGEAYLALEDYQAAEAAFRFVLEAPQAERAQKSRSLSRVAWCRFLMKEPQVAAARFAEVVSNFSDSEEAEEAAFMVGRAQEAGEQIDAALVTWRQYLKDYPEGEFQAEAMLRLSRLEDGQDGQNRLEALLTKHGDSSLAEEALYDLAERLSQDGNYEAALGRYENLLQRFPKGRYAPAGRYGMAWVLYEEGRYLEAAGHLETLAANLKAKEDLRISALELLIWTEQKATRAARAHDAYSRFIQLCQDDERRFEAAKTAAEAFREAGELEAAQAMFDELFGRVQAEPVMVEILVEQTFLALDRGFLENAETSLRTALSLAPSNPSVLEAAFFVGEARFDQKQDAEAAALYHLAANPEVSPVVDQALYKQGFALLRLQDLQGAERCFQSLVEQHGSSDLYGESLFLLGETLFRGQRFEEAVQPLDTLRREIPGHEVMPKALFRLGLTYCRLEDWNQGEVMLSELARRYPEFPNLMEAELWRGRSLSALDNRRAARQAFDRVIKGDRGTLAAQARLGIGHLHMTAGENDAALSEFLKVVLLYSGDEEIAEGLYFAGRCLESLGDADRAKRQYQELLETYGQTGFADAARQRLQELGS